MWERLEGVRASLDGIIGDLGGAGAVEHGGKKARTHAELTGGGRQTA